MTARQDDRCGPFSSPFSTTVSFRRHLRYEPLQSMAATTPIADILRRHSDLAP
jgi:hypothetical protein